MQGDCYLTEDPLNLLICPWVVQGVSFKYKDNNYRNCGLSKFEDIKFIHFLLSGLVKKE